jgi:hypothetical protein
MTSTALDHIEHLSVEIGPRGSTTPQERQAHEYARAWFETLGLETHWEPFTSPTSGWRPFVLASLGGLFALLEVLFRSRAIALAAGLFMLVIAVSVLLELHFKPSPLRLFLPTGPSQNVWARLPAKKTPKSQIVIAGHIDTQRTPWAFTSPKRLAFFQMVSTLGVVTFVISALFYLGMAFFDFGAFRWLALVFAPVYLTVFFVTAQPERTPYTHGANDNASGASVVMSLAGQLAENPLEHIEVWALTDGCEEVGGFGVQAFIRKYRDELKTMSVINLDNLAGKGAGVCYVSREGMLLPLKASPELLSIAKEIAGERTDLNVYSREFTTLHTDGSVFMLNGIPTLSFVGLTPDGMLPDWHQASDTFERVDAKVVEAVEAFVLELLRRMDKS